MTDTGKLNRRITFQRGNTSDDGYGNTLTAWSDILTVWADVRETLGKERVDAGRVEATRTATIRIRRSSDALDITEADRISYNGRIWNIRSIAEVGRDNAMLDILAELGVAA